MRVFLTAAFAVSVFVAVSFAQAASPQKGVCLKVNGEKVEILNLGSAPVVIDRDGIPDFVPTSMVQSVSTAKESKSYDLLLTGVKRNAKKVITSFDIKKDRRKGLCLPKRFLREVMGWTAKGFLVYFFPGFIPFKGDRTMRLHLMKSEQKATSGHKKYLIWYRMR